MRKNKSNWRFNEAKPLSRNQYWGIVNRLVETNRKWAEQAFPNLFSMRISRADWLTGDTRNFRKLAHTHTQMIWKCLYLKPVDVISSQFAGQNWFSHSQTRLKTRKAIHLKNWEFKCALVCLWAHLPCKTIKTKLRKNFNVKWTFEVFGL